MNSYKVIIDELQNIQTFDTLYRFQGGKSFEYFDIKKNRFIIDQHGKYVYFSGNQYHHLYFSIRRIRQLINNVILNGTEYSLCAKQLYNLEKYFDICRLLENSEKLENIYSFKLLTDKSFSKLMKDNSFRSELKPNSSSIERVDRRVFNGGYGIKNEWLELLEYMTFFNLNYKFNIDKILEIVNNMRKTGKINSITNISFLLNEYYNIRINTAIFNDFVKYEIANLLEQIIDKKICSMDSELYKNPTATIKSVINNYLNTKEKTLNLIDKNFNELIK